MALGLSYSSRMNCNGQATIYPFVSQTGKAQPLRCTRGPVPGSMSTPIRNGSGIVWRQAATIARSTSVHEAPATSPNGPADQPTPEPSGPRSRQQNAFRLVDQRRQIGAAAPVRMQLLHHLPMGLNDLLPRGAWLQSENVQRLVLVHRVLT